MINVLSTDVLNCSRVRGLLESSKYGGRVLDWGASGAILNKKRIVEFLNEMGLSETERKLAMSNLVGLANGTEYLLFAWEG